MTNLDDILIDLSGSHLTILLPFEYRYAGTAVYGKGIGTARRIINLKVDENFSGDKTDFNSPEASIRDYAMNQGWMESSIGFLTSASMDSYSTSRMSFENLSIETHLTSGLSNARVAGDKAEYREISSEVKSGGTINTIIICNTSLTLQAAIEALMISAGAKARVLQEMGVKSRVSDTIATGTGTDSSVIIYPDSKIRSEEIKYAGMHTITGELVGQTVITALKNSLAWYRK